MSYIDIKQMSNINFGLGDLRDCRDIQSLEQLAAGIDADTLFARPQGEVSLPTQPFAHQAVENALEVRVDEVVGLEQRPHVRRDRDDVSLILRVGSCTHFKTKNIRI